MKKKRKQQNVHNNKVPHATEYAAILACKALQDKGIHCKYYKRGKSWYLTERYKGSRLIGILNNLNISKGSEDVEISKSN